MKILKIKMRNNLEVLNIKLPDIKRRDRSTKSVKENNKNMIQKIKEKNVIRFKRNIDIINHIKNNSRNTKKIKIATNDKDLTIQSQEKKYNFNITPSKELNALNNNFIYNSIDENDFLKQNINNNSLSKLTSEYKALDLIQLIQQKIHII